AGERPEQRLAHLPAALHAHGRQRHRRITGSQCAWTVWREGDQLMREVIVAGVGPLNIEKLDTDIRAAVDTYAGLKRGRDRSQVTLLFADKASDEAIATAQGMVRAHDPTSKTPEQQVLANLRETAASAAGVA